MTDMPRKHDRAVGCGARDRVAERHDSMDTVACSQLKNSGYHPTLRRSRNLVKKHEPAKFGELVQGAPWENVREHFRVTWNRKNRRSN